jgi:hypothetical protein
MRLFKAGGQTARFITGLENGDGMPTPAQIVGSRHPTETGSDDGDFFG